MDALKTPCVPWNGTMNGNGYGVIRNGTTKIYAHRAAYLKANGEIPDGCEIDHLCMNRCCVNPAHLEAVPHALNIRRGKRGGLWGKKDHECKYGHSLIDASAYYTRNGKSYCKACQRQRVREYRARKEANVRA